MLRTVLSVLCLSIVGLSSAQGDLRSDLDPLLKSVGGRVDNRTDADRVRHYFIDFKGSKLTPQTLAKVRTVAEKADLPVYLNLNNNPQLGDDALAVLEGWKTLYGLGVGTMKVADAGMKHMASLEGLRTLYLAPADDAVTDAGIRHLSGLKGIRRLGIYSKKVTMSAYAHLGELVEVSDLQVNGDPLGDQALAHLGKLQKLVTIQVNEKDLTEKGLRELAKLKGTKKLTFWGDGVSSKALKPAALQLLSGLENLEELEVSSCVGFKESSGPLLGKFSKLRRFSIHNGGAISGEGAKSLAGLANLESVQLQFTESAVIAALAESKSLKTLRFDGGKIGDTEVKPLTRMKTLVSLSLPFDHKVSAEMKAELVKANPMLRISK